MFCPRKYIHTFAWKMQIMPYHLSSGVRWYIYISRRIWESGCHTKMFSSHSFHIQQHKDARVLDEDRKKRSMLHTQTHNTTGIQRDVTHTRVGWMSMISNEKKRMPVSCHSLANLTYFFVCVWNTNCIQLCDIQRGEETNCVCVSTRGRKLRGQQQPERRK